MLKYCFLQHDNDIYDAEKFLIFTTFTHLKSAQNWNFDLTFQTCQSNFLQIYVIIPEIHELMCYWFYIFMRSKNKNDMKEYLI